MSVELVFVPVVVVVSPLVGPRMRLVNGYRPAEVVSKDVGSWVVRDMATGALLAVPTTELEANHE